MYMKNKNIGIIIISFLCLFLTLTGCSSNSSNNGIYQLPNQSYSQMMSYIIHYQNKTIVIDGGTSEDESYLINKIDQISSNNTVDAWFITHYHKDHTGALASYLNKKDNKIKIKDIYYYFPKESEVTKYEPNRLLDLQTINQQLKSVNKKEVKSGDNINIGEMNIEILRTYNKNITTNFGNNSSTVYKITVNDKSILFLGDLGLEGGEELINNCKNDIKEMDYVQMAHHGQAGVSEEVYQIIDPEYCLWPTPQWLWENEDNLYKTDETKSWIDKLNVKKNYVCKDDPVFISLN